MFLYLIRYDYKDCCKSFENVSITDERYVFSEDIELIPIEDLGDYVISDAKLDNPVEEFLTLCGENSEA